ncbi:DUF4139 domain-containing protein [Defluviimonas salinarum]|nr:DUF4139 domain-containing protein [Defluviimonas salinarum]
MRLPLLLATTALWAFPALAESAPVRRVTLYDAGLAEISREADDLSGMTLRIPLRDVNDLLKSLTLRGAGITGARILLDGESPVEDAFSSLPIPPDRIGDVEALLAAIPGTRVRVTPQGGASLEGQVMGIVHPAGCGEAPCPALLALKTEGGSIRRIEILPASEIAILDTAVDAALSRGLAALHGAASGDVRDIRVEIDGAGAAELSYVIAAPAWKTAYRAVLSGTGAVDLQAWAVIENATGEDWEDVGLTLSAGSPRTLRSDLHGRSWRFREELVQNQPEERLAKFGDVMASFAQMDGAAMEMEAPMAARAMAAPAPIAADAAASESVAESRFTFPDPVDLPAGKMISLPFLAGSMEARHLSVWRGGLSDRSGHPSLVLEIDNDLPVRLPAGIMTVEDAATGYVGDAIFPLLAPGDGRAVAFGEDAKVRVDEKVSLSRNERSLSVSQGSLLIRDQEVRSVEYRISFLSGEERDLAIEHPLAAGWSVTATEGAPSPRETRDAYGQPLLAFDIRAADGADQVVRIEEASPYDLAYVIADLSAEDILAWSGREMTGETRAYLERAAGLKQEAVAMGREIEAQGALRARLVTDQERFRTMLGSLQKGSEAHQRFLTSLLAREDEIGAADRRIAELSGALAAARKALSDHLSSR